MINRNKLNIFKGISGAFSRLFTSGNAKQKEDINTSSSNHEEESNFIPKPEQSNEKREKKVIRVKPPVISPVSPLESESRKISNRVITDVFRHDFYSNPEKLRAFHKYLFKRFLRLQISISNASDQSKDINLFGAFKGDSITNAFNTNYEYAITGTMSTGAGSGPQGIAYNPVNQHVYVACPKDNAIVVYKINDTLLTKISLNGFYDLPSPLNIAIHPVSGNAYVTGEGNDTVIVIDRFFKVLATIATVSRPTGITYNPVTGRIYVALYSNDRVAIIDPDSNTIVGSVPTGIGPYGIIANPTNGRVYVANTLSNNLSIIETDGTVKTINGPIGPKYLAYYPPSGNVYVPSTSTNRLYEINGTTDAVGVIGLPPGSGPVHVLYNPVNQYLYIANSLSKSFTVWTPSQTIGTIPLQTIGGGLVFEPVTGSILVSDATKDEVLIMGLMENGGISISTGYQEILEDIKLNPMLLKHVRWALGDGERMYTMKIIQSLPTSKIDSRAFSLGMFYSPQWFQNVLELYTMEGEIIDGNTTWNFKLPAKQTLTILFYYRQLRREILLNKDKK
jgi:YVTN family beta-propeller protein